MFDPNKYTAEIAVIKSLTNTTASDMVIALAVDKAYKAINKHMGWVVFDAEYIAAVYSQAIAYLINDTNRDKLANGERSVTQKSEGSRSVTYANGTVTFDTNGLTDDVKAMLPKPKLRCF